MIVSKTICPLCGEFLERFTQTALDIDKVYVCKTMATTNTDGENYSVLTHHYRLTIMKAQEDSYVEMFFPGYLLVHLMDDNTTSVFKLENSDVNFLFTVPLLDADFTQPHIVQRLKVLTTFS